MNKYKIKVGILAAVVAFAVISTIPQLAHSDPQPTCTGWNGTNGCDTGCINGSKCTIIPGRQNYLSTGTLDKNAIQVTRVCANRLDGPNCDQNNHGTCGHDISQNCNTPMNE